MAAKKRARLLYDKTPKRAAETREGKRRLRKYRAALGAFIDAFAKCEIATHHVLRHHTKTTAEVARAVFSGVRTETASGHLRRLADVGVITAAEWAALEPVMKQLKTISDTRNVILHYGAINVAEGEAIATDAIMALLPERARAFPVSPETLGNMTYDLRKMFLHLVTRHMGRPPLKGTHAELEKVLSAAWRYTPPPQGKNPSPRTGGKEARKPPPGSSQV